MDGLLRALDAGLMRAIGVSNFNQRQTARAVQRLQGGGAVLASNQISYSLLNRSPERNGVLACCEALGVTVIAYSPLAMGMLTGKYSEENPRLACDAGGFQQLGFEPWPHSPARSVELVGRGDVRLLRSR